MLTLSADPSIPLPGHGGKLSKNSLEEKDEMSRLGKEEV
jgi:hypothetical protein